MVDKWLHIDERGGDPWILPIWGAAHHAVKEGKIRELPSEVYELGLHVSTRLNILPRSIRRLNVGVTELYSASTNHKPEHVFSKGTEGAALHIDNDLKYEILCDVDSLLFELNSLCELMTNLFYCLYEHAEHALEREKVGSEIKKLLEEAGQDTEWFSNLSNHRNFFIHEGAPYIAIDISEGEGRYELLVMKENIKNFEDKDKYLTISELNDMVQGFLNSKPVIQEHLVNLFS